MNVKIHMMYYMSNIILIFKFSIIYYDYKYKVVTTKFARAIEFFKKSLNLLNQTYCRIWDSEILCFNSLSPAPIWCMIRDRWNKTDNMSYSIIIEAG